MIRSLQRTWLSVVPAATAVGLCACAAPDSAVDGPAPKAAPTVPEVAETFPRIYGPALSAFKNNRSALEALADRIRQFPKLRKLQPNNINTFFREGGKWTDVMVAQSDVNYTAALESAAMTNDDFVDLTSAMRKLQVLCIYQFDCGSSRTVVRLVITNTGLTFVNNSEVSLLSMDGAVSDTTSIALLAEVAGPHGEALSRLDDGWYLQLRR